MPDDERRDEDPQAEEPQAEEPQAEEPPAAEPQAEEPTVEEPPAPEEPAEEPPAPEEPAEEPSAQEERPAEEPKGEAEEKPKPSKASAEESKKAKDLPPGAELEPITLEPRRELGAEERARLEAEEEERVRREAEATAETGEEEPVARSEPKVELAADSMIQATGKRKSAIARVVLRAGGGAFTVNGRELDSYFPRPFHQTVARQALTASGYDGAVDLAARVHGGGISGQADAVRHGIARALCEIDPELRGELKRRGLLTRDARAKERRKAGLKKARKRPQFSKR
jgi:small subunit ribosomal protein S9